MNSSSFPAGHDKRIVIFSAFSSPFRSGAEACAEEVALRLCDRFAITIITARLRKALPTKSILERKNAYGGISHVQILRVGFGFGFDKWLFPFLAPCRARPIRPHIVHAVLESYAGLAMVLCTLIIPSAKKILTCQSTNTRLLLWIMHQAADSVTCISSVLVKRARALGRPDVYRIPNGINVAAFQNVASRGKIAGRILFVGRLEHMKGVETLLDAFVQLAVKHLQLHLRIVGSGSLRRSLERRHPKSVESGRIGFLGKLSIPDTLKEFAEAEIFCALSRSEALGNVFLEAQAAGCAVVATNVGGIPDIVIDGKTGILVPPNDISAAMHALERLIEDPVLRNSFSEHGKANARKYDWGGVAQEYGSLYEKSLRIPSSTT